MWNALVCQWSVVVSVMMSVASWQTQCSKMSDILQTRPFCSSVCWPTVDDSSFERANLRPCTMITLPPSWRLEYKNTHIINVVNIIRDALKKRDFVGVFERGKGGYLPNSFSRHVLVGVIVDKLTSFWSVKACFTRVGGDLGNFPIKSHHFSQDWL